MRRLIKCWKQLIIITAMIFSVMAVNLNSVNAADGTVSFTWGEEIMYPGWLGNWSTKMCYIDSNLAYCLEASKDTPPENANAHYVIENNDALLKVLYYGYGGPGDVFRDDVVSSDKEKYLFTHIMASYAYSGDLYGGNTWDYLTSIGVGLKARYDQIQSMPTPTNNLYFNGSSNFTTNAYFDEFDKKQRTEDIVLDTNTNASVSIPLQDGVKLHNVTKGTVNTGTVSINGGDVFYLSAPMKALDDYSSGDLGGENLLKYAPLVIKGTADTQCEGTITMTYDPIKVRLNVNWLKVGSLELTKTNTNKDLIDGAVFNLRSASFDSYDENITVTDGKIKVENLLAGTYKLKEVSAPDGYLIDETEYEVTINVGETTTKIIENNEPTGSISLTKEINTDLTDGKLGDAYLQGNEYKLFAREDITNKAGTVTYFKQGDVVATQTTNSEGKLKFDDLHIGKYYIKESKSNETLVLNSKDINIDIEYEGQTVSKVLRSTNTDNRVNMQKIQLHKSGEKDGISGIVKGLQGAEFTFKLKSEVDHVGWDNAKVYDVITTDKDGHANTKYLPYGEYLVRETKTPKDYLTAPDFIVSVTKDYSEYADIAQIKIIDINNRPYTTQLKIVKKDLDSNKTVTLNSATFKVKAREDIVSNGKVIYKAGETIKQKISGKTYDSFTTSANNVVIPAGSFNIESNKGSVILPLQLDAGKYYIDEIKTPTGYLSLEKAVNFTIENIRDYDQDQDGDPILEVVVKNDKPTGTLEVLKSVKLNKETDKSFVGTNDLSKIKFRLTAKENIYDRADGSIIYAKGATVGEYNLSKDGKLTVADLPMGIYELQEISTLDGLVLDETKHEVKFEQTDLTTKVYTVSQNLVNKPTLVELSKTDVTGEKELPGASMSVLDKDGKVIDSWISGNKSHLIEGLRVNKTYILKEDLAPIGYVQASEIEFTVKNTADLQKVHMIDKIMTINKVDADSKGLKDVTLQVINEQGKIIDKWITDGTGKHNVSGLKAGKTYTLQEADVPGAYTKSLDIEFTVLDDGKNQSLTMTNKKLIISKKDMNNNELTGAHMQILDKDGNTVESWITDEKPYETSNLLVGSEYTLREVKAPDGYVKQNDITFTIKNDGKDQTVTMLDNYVEIAKQTLNGEELTGARMQILDKDGNIADEWISGQNIVKITDSIKSALDKDNVYTGKANVQGNVLDVMITTLDKDSYRLRTLSDNEYAYYNIDIDGNETSHMIRNLVADGSYTLKEVKAPDGYVIAKDQAFTISDKDISIVMTDKQVEISKQTLNGEELTGAHMQILDKDGNVTDSWISGNKPHFASNLIEGKTYILKEDLAPLGYNTANEFEFTVSYDKETQKVEMIDTITEISKVSEDDKYIKYAELEVISSKTRQVVDYWVTGQHIIDIDYTIKEKLEDGKTISNMFIDQNDDGVVQYTIKNNDDKDDYLVQLVKDGIVSYYNVDINGNETRHMIQNLTAGQEYILREVKTPNGYVTAKERYFIAGEDENINLTMVDEDTKVEISKQDITTQKELPGAELEIKDENGKIIDKWVSGKEPHMIKNLIAGKTYTLTETIAPDGYKIAQSIKFEVKDTGEVQHVVMYDELLPTSGGKTADDTDVTAMILLVSMSGLGMVSYGMYEFFKKRYD